MSETEKVLNEVYRDNAVRMKWYVYAMVGNLEESKDVVQEAFVELWKIMTDKNRVVTHARGLVWRIATFRAKSYWANKHRRDDSFETLTEAGLPPASCNNIEENIDAQDAKAAVNFLMQRYPETMELLSLRYLKCMENVDIEQKFGKRRGWCQIELGRDAIKARHLLEQNGFLAESFDFEKKRELVMLTKNKMRVSRRDGPFCKSCQKVLERREMILQLVNPDGVNSPKNMRIVCEKCQLKIKK